MRLLFELDAKDYDINGVRFVRPSARGIIIKNGLIALVHSIKYDYYKFPGGGIEKDELKTDALKREVTEETGLIVIDESIKEYGYVHRIQKGKIEDVFEQDNYYYLCDCVDEITKQSLDKYEEEENFTLEFINPYEAIKANRTSFHGPKDNTMLERDTKVLELLIEKGYFND